MRGARTFRATAAKYGVVRWGGVTEAAREGVSMHTHLSQDPVEHAILIVSLLRPLAESISRKDRELSSQLRRAASSTALNLAEGFGSAAGNARLRFQTARGSLYEAQAALRVAVAWGYIPAENAREALESMHVLGGRVYGLARR